MNESDSPHRQTDRPAEPAFRVRKSDVFAGISLAGLLSILGLFWNITSQLSENLRTEVRSAENRIINRIAANEQLLYKCCGRGR